MADRYDVVTMVERNGKTYSVRLGTAFPFKEGKDGFTILLDAVPAPQDGQFKMNLFPPKPRDSERAYRDAAQPVRQGGSGLPPGDDLSDEIPFLPQKD